MQLVAAHNITYSEHLLHLSVVNFNNAHCRLAELQREFRQHFSEIIDITALTKLEKQEKEKFEQAWPLWYQFAHNPDQYWKKAPDIKAKAIINITANELIKSIEKSLTQKLPNDLTATILSADYPYSGQKALWITVELQDFAAFEYCFVQMVNALTHAIRPMAYKDLKFFIMEGKWKNVVIVPMINGLTLTNISWVLLMASFVGEGAVLDESKSWLYIPRPIERPAIEYFNFKETATDITANLINLLTELKEIYITINHAYCFFELLNNAGDTGLTVLQAHLTTMMPDLTTSIKQANKEIVKFKSKTQNIDEDLEFLLDIIEDAISPFEQPDDNQIVIQLQDCEEWAHMLNNAIAALQIHIWQNLS